MTWHRRPLYCFPNANIMLGKKAYTAVINPPVAQYTVYTYDWIYLPFLSVLACCSIQRQMSMSNFRTFPHMGCSPQQHPWSPSLTPTMSRTTIPPDNSLAMVQSCVEMDKGLLTANFFFASSLGKDMCIGRMACQAAEDAKGGMDAWEKEPQMNWIDFCTCSSPLLSSTR